VTAASSEGDLGRIAVVTPYFQEDEATLRRCIDSVAAQTVKCDHILVADGHPQEFIDGLGLRHIKLDRSHSDYGNTPRGIAAQLAISEGYGAIAFLDADNWYEPDHVELCLAAATQVTGDPYDCDYVVAKRRFVSPDLKTIIELARENGVDTNCFFFLPGAFHMIPFWNLMPQEVASLGDFIFGGHLHYKNLVHRKTDKITVNYLNLWEYLYTEHGLPAPMGAKPRVLTEDLAAWFYAQPPRRLEILKRRMGVWFKQ
jgi:glycosyltransferase involved in cell wall biosynthesis